MHYIAYLLLRIFTFLFALLPFPLIYLHSDILFFLLYHVFSYRKNVVNQNLRNSFPDKSEKEIRKIVKAFYVNLCDIIIESIISGYISKKTYLKRYPVINPEILNSYYENGKSVIAMAAHYTNWEWGVVSFAFQFKHNSIGLYKPVKNKYIDRFMMKQRSVWGLNLVSIYDTYKSFSEKNEIPAIYFMISDQSPSNLKKAIWVHFLNQDTPCIHGAETYAKMFNLPVVFIDLQRIKRGYYSIKITLIEENPQVTNHGEITGKYMKKLEELIRSKPENWLWSHKRWKHKRETIESINP
jgi:KDO2-lipid IV(A) lauroyltransferase